MKAKNIILFTLSTFNFVQFQEPRNCFKVLEFEPNIMSTSKNLVGAQKKPSKNTQAELLEENVCGRVPPEVSK